MPVAEPKIVPRLKRRYDEEIRPMMIERFGYKTPMQAPRLVKITVNMGVGDAKQDTNMLQAATEQLQTLTGQRPSVRRARKSIANFKLREEMPVGVAVTLRRARMWEFFDRLTSVAIPRIRDFRGLSPRSFDGRGNYSMGVREQIIFPEIDYDSIDQVRGLDISITTSAPSDEEAFALLSELGMPFRRDDTGGGPTAAEVRAQQEAKAKAEAERAALEQLKEENPEAYAKKAAAPEAEGDEAADSPAEPAGDQET
jgi:large subunit ribosomal protein L5